MKVAQMLITAKLEESVRIADCKAKAARASAARLRRELERAKAARSEELHRIVGASVMQWCAGDERVRAATVRYIRSQAERLNASGVNWNIFDGSVLGDVCSAVPSGGVEGPSIEVESD